MSILNKYLAKCGVKEFSHLTELEKDTFNEWQEILSGRKITDEDVTAFFNEELESTTVKLITKKLSEREDIFLKMKIEFIRNIKSFLDSPKKEKAMMEQNINNLLKN